jgi:hypothetical protein
MFKSQHQTKMKEFLALPSSHPTAPPSPGPVPVPLGKKPWVNKKFLGENWSLTLISDQECKGTFQFSTGFEIRVFLANFLE